MHETFDVSWSSLSEHSLCQLMQMLNFSSENYRGHYQDLAVLDDDQALLHFVNHGHREGRQPMFRIRLADGRERLEWLKLEGDKKSALWRDILISHLFRRDIVEFNPQEVASLITDAPDFQPIVIFGDSHSRFFSLPEPFINRALLPILCLCSGGSARGLGNANSRAGYGARIRQTLSAIPAGCNSLALFKFGQVDIEFVYNFKRLETKSTTFDLDNCLSYLYRTAEIFVEFVEDCALDFSQRVAICSVFPPTLKDEVLRQGYVNAHIGFLNSDAAIEELSAGLRRLELPKLTIRTLIHRAFNTHLEELCSARDIPFVSEFEAMIGPDGVVGDPFICSHGGTDHHLSFDAPETRVRVNAVAGALGRLANANR